MWVTFSLRLVQVLGRDDQVAPHPNPRGTGPPPLWPSSVGVTSMPLSWSPSARWTSQGRVRDASGTPRGRVRGGSGAAGPAASLDDGLDDEEETEHDEEDGRA